MTKREAIFRYVSSLSNCTPEEIEEAMWQAGISETDEDDGRDYDILIEDVMNCLGLSM